MNRVDKKVLSKFKQILHDMKVEYEEIYLFGSRAKGSNNKGSDWDFYILLKIEMESVQKRELKGKIRMKFHDFYPLEPIDIIINDKNSFNNQKNIVNTISNEVFSEGVLL